MDAVQPAIYQVSVGVRIQRALQLTVRNATVSHGNCCRKLEQAKERRSGSSENGNHGDHGIYTLESISTERKHGYCHTTPLPMGPGWIAIAGVGHNFEEQPHPGAISEDRRSGSPYSPTAHPFCPYSTSECLWAHTNKCEVDKNRPDIR